jgi:hypothetical protein
MMSVRAVDGVILDREAEYERSRLAGMLGRKTRLTLPALIHSVAHQSTTTEDQLLAVPSHDSVIAK